MTLKSTKLLAGLSAAALLSACGGGGKLSFKNADTVIKSYKSVIKDMSEAERQTFNRNMVLILEDNDTPPSELKLSDWRTASSQGRQFGALAEDTNPFVREVASEIALQGAESLNGKSVSYVNKRGAEIESDIIKAAAASTEVEIVDLKAVLKKIDADKSDHKKAHDAALKAENALVQETNIYATTAKVKSLSKNRSRQSLDTVLTIVNPHEGTLQNGTIEVKVGYKGYSSRYNIPLSYTLRRVAKGQTGTQNSKINLSGSSFLDADGKPLARDHAFSQTADDYKLTARPIKLSAGNRKNGVKQHDYKLTNDQSQDLYQYHKRLEQCVAATTSINDAIAKKQEKLELIKSGEIDDINTRGGWGSRTPKGCAVKKRGY